MKLVDSGLPSMKEQEPGCREQSSQHFTVWEQNYIKDEFNVTPLRRKLILVCVVILLNILYSYIIILNVVCSILFDVRLI